jgi:hypothetical protein
MAEPSASVDRELKAKYDAYYGGRDNWRRIGAIDKVRDIEAICRGHRFDEVVEVGAGEGSVLARLEEVGFARNLYGLEISDSGLAAIRARQLRRVREVCAFDGYKMPYRDERFDLAIATHVLEHVEHERLFLRELQRVSKYVFIEVPLEDTWRVAQAIKNDIGHINFYRRETLLALLESVGLRPLRQGLFDCSISSTLFRKGVTRGIPRHLIRRSLLLTAPKLAERFLTYHFAVLATRS